MEKDKGRGQIVCKPGSKEAKRIEATHGFNAALVSREERDAERAKGRKPASKPASGRGDKS